MNQYTQNRKVLVLRGQHGKNQELVQELQSSFQVTVVDKVEDALHLLETDSFDAVFSETSDFLPLERAAVSQQAVGILNTIGEGVCIVGPDGTILWANTYMNNLDDEVKKGVCTNSLKAYEQFDKRLNSAPKPKHIVLPPRKYSYTDQNTNRYFEMIVTPMLDPQLRVAQVTAVVWEETASRRLQQRIDAIDKAGSELVRIEAESIRGMTVEQRISVIQDKIIRNAKQLLHFDHFVVRLLNPRTNELEVLFGVGLPGDVSTEVFANSQGNGITGYVAATGRSYICNDLASDPRYLPGLDHAVCSLTVPLRLHDKVIGTLNVESNKEAAFGEDDRQMAEIFGRYVAISLNVLNLLVEERYQTTGQAIDVLSQCVAQPLSDIITNASMLKEDYIGHDKMRQMLDHIIENVVTVKNAVKEAQKPPKGVLMAGAVPHIETTDDQLAGKQILVVDDEQAIRQTIADVVQKFGCVTDMARDGQEAIALIKQRPYDLVISDIKLPKATGYEVFAAAKTHNPDLPVILMTGFGYDPNHSIVRANREGLAAVLYKPFKVDELMKEIRQAVV